VLSALIVFALRHSGRRMRQLSRSPSRSLEAKLDRLQLVLGMSQMAGVTVAVILLIATGVSEWAVLATVVTCVMTTVSVMLFGAKRRGH
jgi:hypothetical protein